MEEPKVPKLPFLKNDKDKHIAILVGIVGIAVTLAVAGIKKSNAANASTAANTQSAVTPSTSTFGDAGTSGTSAMDPIAAALQLGTTEANDAMNTALGEAQIAADHSATFNFSSDNQYMDTATQSSQNSGGGFAGISFLGITLGGSRSSAQSQSSSQEISGSTPISVGLTGLTESEVNQLIANTNINTLTTLQDHQALQQQGQGMGNYVTG